MTETGTTQLDSVYSRAVSLLLCGVRVGIAVAVGVQWGLSFG